MVKNIFDDSFDTQTDFLLFNNGKPIKKCASMSE